MQQVQSTRANPGAASEMTESCMSGIETADIVLKKNETRGWSVTIVTTQARHWALANCADQFDGQSPSFTLTLRETNNFLKHAREAKLLTEYHGPNGTHLL